MITTVAAVTMAVLAALGSIGGLVTWLHKRGRQEQSLASSVDKQADATNRNTQATELLAAQVGGLRDTLEAHGNTLIEHHWRIKALEGSK